MKLKGWIREIMVTKGENLFRYKGVLAVKGSEMRYVFQSVHMLFRGNLEPKRQWKPDEARESRLVFIGWNLDKEALREGIIACRVEPLRFEEGDRVEMYIGHWMVGTVGKLWDEGYPYFVELDLAENGKGCYSWI